MIFAFFYATGAYEPDGRTIVVDAERRKDLFQAFTTDRGRPPTPEELEQVVENWIDGEVLFREGLALGIDAEDRAVRRRVIRKMWASISDFAYVEPPNENDLREYFEEHSDRYHKPARYTIRHVFSSGLTAKSKRQAEVWVAKLRAGADPKTLGERFKSGHRLWRRTEGNLANLFGGDWATDLPEAQVGTWHLRSSADGWHAVLVEEVEPAVARDYQDVRTEIATHLQEQRRTTATKNEVRALRERFEIRVE